MSETTRMRAPYFELQMGAGPSLLLDELRILRERNEQQHAEAAELRRQIDEQAGQMALQRARIAELEGDLAFVERWANHHGQKPCITPQEALSVIQHYPPIKAITRSYADGKLPPAPIATAPEGARHE